MGVEAAGFVHHAAVGGEGGCEGGHGLDKSISNHRAEDHFLAAGFYTSISGPAVGGADLGVRAVLDASYLSNLYFTSNSAAEWVEDVGGANAGFMEALFARCPNAKFADAIGEVAIAVNFTDMVSFAAVAAAADLEFVAIGVTSDAFHTHTPNVFETAMAGGAEGFGYNTPGPAAEFTDWGLHNVFSAST